MKRIKLGKSGLSVPNIAVGCMRLRNKTLAEAEAFLETALELGLNYFDHADIYGAGLSEELFAQAFALNDDRREQIILQSKCGITKDGYNFSKSHILSSVEGSLQRLKTDYLDVLLLHRPDALCEPEEVAETFRQLKEQGKVRYFGVSNHNPGQIKLLQKYLDFPLVVNQMQLSLAHCPMIESGINVNTAFDGGLDREGGVLDFCRLQDITLQAWSPLQHGFIKGTFLNNPDYPELNDMLQRVAEEYGTTKAAIAVAWIARHPAHIQTVTGTTNPQHLMQCAEGAQIELTRKQWYDLYKSVGRKLP